MSDEEDYMSDAFLTKCADVRPGLLNKDASRKVELQKKQNKSAKESKTIPKHQLEKERRQEGLNNAIGSDNKGFLLMQKMGFRPGMSIGLGKSGTGRTEPVPISVKAGRTGLGHDSERREKRHAASALQFARRKKRQIEEEKLRDDFKCRMSSQVNERLIERDLYKSQKVCEHLDSSNDVKEPVEPFFWPKRPVQKLDEEEDEEEEEDDDISSDEKLKILTAHLRTKYVYCLWCGTSYSDQSDLNANCPGDNAADHDD